MSERDGVCARACRCYCWVGQTPHSDPTKSQRLPARLEPPVVERAWLRDRRRMAAHAPEQGFPKPLPWHQGIKG